MAKAEVIENLGGGFYRIRPLKKLKGVAERISQLEAKEANLQVELSQTGSPQVRADLINTQSMIANLRKAAADRVLFCISADENENIPEGTEVPVLEHGRSGNTGNYTIAPGDYVFDSKQHSEIVTTQELKKWEWLYARIAQPLAIVHRPKFWFGRILSIAGDQLTADVSIFPRDVENKPLLPKATREHNCDCDYRQGNDFARFSVGDIVVVDFHFGAGTPTVIGFAVNPENPVFEPVIPKSEGFELNCYFSAPAQYAHNRLVLIKNGTEYSYPADSHQTASDETKQQVLKMQQIGTQYPIEFELHLYSAFLDDAERNYVQPAVIPHGQNPDNFAAWLIPGTATPYEPGVHASMPYVTHNLRMQEKFSELAEDNQPGEYYRKPTEFGDVMQTVDSRSRGDIVSYDELQSHELPFYVESLARPIAYPTCIVLDEQGNPSSMRFYDPETFTLLMDRPLRLDYDSSGDPVYTRGCNPFSCVHGKRPIFNGSYEEILHWGMQEYFFPTNNDEKYLVSPGYGDGNGGVTYSGIHPDGRVYTLDIRGLEYQDTVIGEEYAYNIIPQELGRMGFLISDTGSEQYPRLLVTEDVSEYSYYDNWGGTSIPDFVFRNMYPGKVFGTDSGILTVRNEATGDIIDRVDIPQMGIFINTALDTSRSAEVPHLVEFVNNRISFGFEIAGTLHKSASY